VTDNLEERVHKFNALQLPGQPIGMHMGTSYLVNDLWREVKRLRDGFREIKKATVDGRVCDDVAWFDTITTLYDFCDLFLRAPTHERGADVETKPDAS